MYAHEEKYAKFQDLKKNKKRCVFEGRFQN
jgi:hypothetical protein